MDRLWQLVSSYTWFVFVASCVCVHVLGQLLTADGIGLVRAVCTLRLSVTAPPSGNTLSVLAGEVSGGARLLRCGDRGDVHSLSFKGELK